MFVILTPNHALQDPDLANQRRKRPAKRTSDHGRPSQQNSCKDSKRSSRQIAIWPSRGGRTWHKSWASTSPRSKSGFRTSGPKSKRPLALKTVWPCTWWHRDCTITPLSRKTRNQTAIDFHNVTAASRRKHAIVILWQIYIELSQQNFTHSLFNKTTTEIDYL